MRTTLIKLSISSLLLSATLAASTTISFANPAKKTATMGPTSQSLTIVGRVEHVNKDRTFELVTSEGQKYLVRMSKDALVNAYAPFPDQKTILSFEDLYKGARLVFRAEPVQPTSTSTSSTSSPSPVVTLR